MEIQTSNKIDGKKTALISVRIVAIVILIISIIGLLWSLDLFKFAGHLFSSQQNVAEDQAHGEDALGGLISGFLGLVYLGISLVFFVTSALTILFTNMALRKKVAVRTRPTATTSENPQTSVAAIPTTPEESSKTDIVV